MLKHILNICKYTKLFKHPSSNRILYEHEMILPETKRDRLIRYAACLFGTIVFISELIPLYISSKSFYFIITMIIIAVWWIYMFIVCRIENNLKIRVILTDDAFLLRAPSTGYMVFPGFNNIKIPNNKILSVKTVNLRSPELKKIMHENGRFKLCENQKLYIRPYRYVFTINSCPLPYNTRFVEISFQDSKPILFESDDPEGFIDILKRNVSLQAIYS